MADEQAGFRKDRSTTQQILMLRLLAVMAKRKGIKIYNCFVDCQKTFDLLDQQSTWAIMKSYGIEEKLVKILQLINTKKLQCESEENWVNGVTSREAHGKVIMSHLKLLLGISKELWTRTKNVVKEYQSTV